MGYLHAGLWSCNCWKVWKLTKLPEVHLLIFWTGEHLFHTEMKCYHCQSFVRSRRFLWVISPRLFFFWGLSFRCRGPRGKPHAHCHSFFFFFVISVTSPFASSPRPLPFVRPQLDPIVVGCCDTSTPVWTRLCRLRYKTRASNAFCVQCVLVSMCRREESNFPT